MIPVALVVIALCVVVAVLVARRHRFDCGYTDCDQRHNEWHSHAGRRPRWQPPTGTDQ